MPLNSVVPLAPPMPITSMPSDPCVLGMWDVSDVSFGMEFLILFILFTLFMEEDRDGSEEEEEDVSDGACECEFSMEEDPKLTSFDHGFDLEGVDVDVGIVKYVLCSF